MHPVPSPQPPPEYADVMAPFAAGMSLVDQVIHERLHSSVDLVEKVATYIIQGGGKRIRPALVLMADAAISSLVRREASHASVDDWQPSQPVLELAAIVEFIHTATLLHDDVVDESSLRRARQTANAVFGNAASVLVGDFLYSRAFQMMVGCQSMGVMAVLSEATNVIAEGEVLQLINCQDPDVDENRYLTVIRYKTAKLFEASAQLPAVLSGLPAPLTEALARYGRHLGTAFQLTDDILDYDGHEAEMGKQLGDDLREGKPTLPLIYLLAQGSADDKAAIEAAISRPDEVDAADIIRRVQSSPALDYARAAARREADLAASALAALPDSRYKASLLDLAAFVLTRHA